MKLAQVGEVLGLSSDREVRDVVHRVVRTRPAGTGEVVDVEEVAGRVLDTVQNHRATWTMWHLRAGAERRLRPAPVRTVEDRDMLAGRVTRAPGTVVSC